MISFQTTPGHRERERVNEDSEINIQEVELATRISRILNPHNKRETQQSKGMK